MINRDSRGHPYSIVRGEILGFMEDELLRKHLPRMFSLISERKLGDRRRLRPWGGCLVVHRCESSLDVPGHGRAGQRRSTEGLLELMLGETHSPRPPGHGLQIK